MFNFICNILKFLPFSAFRNKRSLILIILSLKKENEILKRHLNLAGKKIKTKRSERFILSVLSILSRRVEKHLCIVKPETLLKWQKYFIKKHWTYKRKKPGRPALTKKIKQLILQMKNENNNWGTRRIEGELRKLGINIDHSTINRVIQTF